MSKKHLTGFELLREGKILIIKFNDVKTRNAVSSHDFEQLGVELRAASTDDTITTIVFTGTNDFYTSGKKLSETYDPHEFSDLEMFYTKINESLSNMLSALIDCPKLTIALVNGPCIGIGATMTALCDLAWCADTAYFLTPFTKLGLCAEGCSSFLYPLILGRSKATEMLLLSEPMTAQEALQFNFVSRVFKFSELETVAWPKIREYSELPKGPLYVTKQLIATNSRSMEHQVVKNEIQELKKLYSTDEYLTAMANFVARRNKSKL